MRIPHFGKWMVLAVLVGAQGAVSAASVIHTPIDAGDICTRCKRIIFERHVAAEIVPGHDAEPLKFRTVRCMLTYLQKNTGPVKDVYVVDYPSGRLVAAEDATFVAVPIDLRTGIANYGVGDIDYLAFRSAHDAEHVAGEYGINTQDWASVRYYSAFLPTRGDSE